MKKVFISCPFRGRTEEAIQESINKMHEIAEIAFGCELEAVDNYGEHSVPDGSRSDMYNLGTAIQKMAMCDYFIGISYPGCCFGGCDVENYVASVYNIPSVHINMDKYVFLKDALKLLKNENKLRIPEELRKEVKEEE